MKSGYILAPLFLAAAFSCSTDSYFPTGDKSDTTLQVEAIIQGNPSSRVSGSDWTAGDRIGIFVVRDGTPAEQNKIYSTASGSGLFTPVNDLQAINLQLNGPAISLLSYHPYSDKVTGTELPLDLSDQSQQELIDLLYSDNITDFTFTGAAPEMEFRHVLSKLVITITAGEGIDDLSGLTATISGVKTGGTFNILNGELTLTDQGGTELELSVTASGTTATVEGILFPMAAPTATEITFVHPQHGEFTFTLPADKAFAAGQRHIYSITLNADGTTEPVTYKWLEAPAVADIPNTEFVTHYMPSDPSKRNYSMLYDTDLRMAYWVAYPLHTSHFSSGSRTDDYDYDPQIPNEYQGVLYSGFGSSTYNRGHQIPSGDRTTSSAANRQTFYFTNITPQNITLNGGLWVTLENKVRTWAGQCDTIYVVTGAMPPANNQQFLNDNSGDPMAIPDYYFKALAKRTGDTYYTAAFVMENVGLTGNNLTPYRMTVAELEEKTGFVFYPSLSDNDKNNIVSNQWQ